MELKFVNNSYFKQLFQNLRPNLQYSKNRIFVTSHFGTLLGRSVTWQNQPKWYTNHSVTKNALGSKFCRNCLLSKNAFLLINKLSIFLSSYLWTLVREASCWGIFELVMKYWEIERAAINLTILRWDLVHFHFIFHVFRKNSKELYDYLDSLCPKLSVFHSYDFTEGVDWVVFTQSENWKWNILHIAYFT